MFGDLFLICFLQWLFLIRYNIQKDLWDFLILRSGCWGCFLVTWRSAHLLIVVAYKFYVVVVVNLNRIRKFWVLLEQ
jgi:hypothetical protein